MGETASIAQSAPAMSDVGTTPVEDPFWGPTIRPTPAVIGVASDLAAAEQPEDVTGFRERPGQPGGERTAEDRGRGGDTACGLRQRRGLAQSGRPSGRDNRSDLMGHRPAIRRDPGRRDRPHRCGRNDGPAVDALGRRRSCRRDHSAAAPRSGPRVGQTLGERSDGPYGEVRRARRRPSWTKPGASARRRPLRKRTSAAASRSCGGEPLAEPAQEAPSRKGSPA